VQVKILPRPCLQGEAAGGSLRRAASPRVDINPQPSGAVEDDGRADEFPVSGRRVVAQIGAGT
jgi:hypothetical protein